MEKWGQFHFRSTKDLKTLFVKSLFILHQKGNIIFGYIDYF